MDEQLKPKPETHLEVKANKDQEKQYQYQGSLDIHPGQKAWAWAFNTKFEEIFEVDLQDESNFHYYDDPKRKRIKRVITKPGFIYVVAINRKNAGRKLLAKFGFKFNAAGTSYTTDIPTEKLPDELIEINKPEGPQEKIE